MAPKFRIPHCLFKKKAQPGRAGDQMSQSQPWHLGKRRKIMTGLVLRQGWSRRLCFSKGFGRVGVFYPGRSLEPLQFLFPTEIHVGRDAHGVGSEASL